MILIFADRDTTVRVLPGLVAVHRDAVGSLAWWRSDREIGFGLPLSWLTKRYRWIYLIREDPYADDGITLERITMKWRRP
jgi:hypothetical protein